MISRFWLGLIVGVLIGVAFGLPAGLMLRESFVLASGKELPALPKIRIPRSGHVAAYWHDHYRLIVLAVALTAITLAGAGLVGLAVTKSRADTAVDQSTQLGLCVAGFQQDNAISGNKARHATIRAIRSERRLWLGLLRPIVHQSGTVDTFRAKILDHVDDLTNRIETYRDHPPPPPDLCATVAPGPLTTAPSTDHTPTPTPSAPSTGR